MEIREISPDILKSFSDEVGFNDYHQTLNYALLKVEEGFEYEIIGLYDNDTIKAACVVLGNAVGPKTYAYIPGGFIIDYNDKGLLEVFTQKLKQYGYEQGFTFMKINPRVITGIVNKKDGSVKPTEMSFLPDLLQSIGYTKLKDNMYFESTLPRFNAIVDLDTFDYTTISKNNRNKVNKASRKGVIISFGNNTEVDFLNNLLEEKMGNVYYHYSDYYNIFQKDDMLDYFVAEINYEEFLKNAEKAYDEELYNNRELNTKVINHPTKRNVNHKMNSDRALEAYHSDILNATKLINTKSGFVAAAMVIKYKDTVTLLISDFDKKYNDYAVNYLLIYSIINHYKGKYKYFDLNGIVADFKDNPYHGLNRFKIGFNPKLVQYAGEYDLVINKSEYDHLNKKGYLADEFNKF